ncbi:glutamate synthase-related protein [Coxiella-like endosymbiont of Rhipicephalus sanguineus]|uniref:glutamate synthase-related protein n=1 Tax=Coxiella-like endosymbiont of Rhipicephalus sanguineus TaxID=1955402 RepID=UPI0020413598|nr:glutamate synthase-related protein [Coxiella-like endosymbiont of Rhipicephalus sanguineus]
MGIYPNFIVIYGSEGGTGAAPLEFFDRVGMPLNEGLIFAYLIFAYNNCLVGIGAPSTYPINWQ